MKQYIKAGLGALAAAATWGVVAGADGHYEQVELWGLLGVLVAAVAVYYAPYHPAEKDQ